MFTREAQRRVIAVGMNGVGAAAGGGTNDDFREVRGSTAPTAAGSFGPVRSIGGVGTDHGADYTAETREAPARHAAIVQWFLCGSGRY